MLKLWLIFGCLHLELFIKTQSLQMLGCFTLKDDACPNSNISFWLYNSKQPDGVLVTSDSWDFDKTMPLKVLIHGFNGSYKSTPNLELIPALLEIPNMNVISIDYSYLALDPCYIEAVENAHVVGRCLGYFLSTILNDSETMPRQLQLHLIGFGIGAHVAAFASNYLSVAKLKVSHITALDPAKPLYLTNDLLERLDPSDADFVDVIHSDIVIHGVLQPIGHVDFYPNKGVVQPNCGPIDNITTNQCYHRRAAVYYAESINSPNVFWAFRCKDLYAFIVGECQPNRDVEQLGYFTRESARGSYFLSTNGDSPYSKGRDFTNLDRSLYNETYMGNDLITMLKELGPDVRRLSTEIGG